MVSQDAACPSPGFYCFLCPSLLKIQHLRGESWIGLTWLSVPLRSRRMGQGQFTKVQLQRDRLGRKSNRQPPEWARSTANGLTDSSIFLSRGIHWFIPPTLSTDYESDNVLDAENTVFNNSIVQIVRCIPGTEELGRMTFPEMQLQCAHGTSLPILVSLRHTH